MKSRNSNPLSLDSIPQVTDDDRAAGFKDWESKMRDGSIQTLRVYPMCMIQFAAVLPPKPWTYHLYAVLASGLRKPIEFAMTQLDGVSAAQIFIIAYGLHSQAFHGLAVAAGKAIAGEVMTEWLPPTDPPSN
jgi:hypothetical protein